MSLTRVLGFTIVLSDTQTGCCHKSLSAYCILVYSSPGVYAPGVGVSTSGQTAGLGRGQQRELSGLDPPRLFAAIDSPSKCIFSHWLKHSASLFC